MTKFVKIILSLSAFFSLFSYLSFPISAQSAPEQRAVWLQDTNDIDNKLTKLKNMHINTIYFGAWGSNDLNTLINKVHAKDMKIHLWEANNYICSGHWSDCAAFATGKNWDAVLPNGMTRQSLTGPGNLNNKWIDFNIPEAQLNSIKVMVDYAKNYPNLDGVNFDYIRYDHANYSFSSHNLTEFQQLYNVDPAVMRGDQFPAFATIWGNRVYQFSSTVTRLVDFLNATTAAVFINNYINDPTESHGQVLTFNWQAYNISYKVIDTVLTRALNHFNASSHLYVVNTSSNNTDYNETVNWLNFLGFSSLKADFAVTNPPASLKPPGISDLPTNATLIIPAIYVYSDPIILAVDTFVKNGGNVIFMDGPTTTISGGVANLTNLQLFKNIIGASASHSYIGAYDKFNGIVSVPTAAQNHWMVTGLTSTSPITQAQAMDYFNKWQAYMETGITNVVKEVTRQVHEISPDMKTSADVFPAEKGANVGLRQNWPLWLANNYIDYVKTMNYTLKTSDFDLLVAWINGSGQRDKIFPGLGPYVITDCAQVPIITGQIDKMRANNIKGFSMFQSNYLTESSFIPASCGIANTLTNYFGSDVEPYYPSLLSITPTLTPTPTLTSTPTPIPTTTQTAFYVSKTGADTNPGTFAQPFLTIQKGVDKATSPGDQVIVMPGNYTQSDNYIYGNIVNIENKHGQPGKDIVIKAYDLVNKPVLRGYTGIKVMASSYITVEGFEITDTTNSSIPLYLSDHITVKNNYIHLGYEGNCSTSETGAYAGCTYHVVPGIGEIKGRHDKNGNIIVESDGIQNTGIYLCKTINSTFSNNRIVNADEGIYAGKSGVVGMFNCWDGNDAVIPTIPPKYDYIYKNNDRNWVEGNLFEGNLIENAWNEAIELKPDTRNNIIRGNVTKSTRQFIESSQIEIRGNSNEIIGNVVVGSPNIGIRTIAETAVPGSAFGNYIHHNYVYYWSEYTPSALGINSHDLAVSDRIEHNTIVGTNHFPAVSEYASIKSNSIPSTMIKDNLMVGLRRVSTTENAIYEYDITAYANKLPSTSDYNAYYPRLKNNNLSCVVSLAGQTVKCQNGVNTLYEVHSQFLDANPIHTDEAVCTKDQLISLPIEQIEERVKYCSSPIASAAILNTASDATNIGAWQSTEPLPTLSPTIYPTPTETANKPGDANNDQKIDGQDYAKWLSYYGQNLTGVIYGDFDNNGTVDGRDYVIWLSNYGK
jgi:uncharacterized lipoprotein YddW (UPF0748 family)